MKGILEFNLPEDQEDFKMATNVLSYYCALEEMRSFLRGINKYEELTEIEEKLMERITDKFYEECGELLG